MKKFRCKTYNATEMLSDKAKYEAAKRRYYRGIYCRAVLSSVTAFCIGSILMAFFKAGGLSGLLFAAFMFGLGAFLALLLKN